MVSARARRLRVGYARNRGISARRACALLPVSRSTLGYCSKMARKDEPVTAAMQELSGQHPRFGYRRIQVFLKRRGLRMSADRAYRIWSAAGLQVPKKRPRRRLACSRPRPVPATAENRVWAYDFVFDACANGQHSIFPSDRSALEAHQRSWRAEGTSIGPWTGVRLQGDPQMARQIEYRHRVH